MGTYSITVRGAQRPPRTATRLHVGPTLRRAAAAAPLQPMRARPTLARLSVRVRLGTALIALLANVALIGGVLALFASRG